MTKLLKAFGLLAITAAVASLAPAHAQTTVRYLHTDALGTVGAKTDANGNVVERTTFEPYGAVVGGAVADGPGYTGHVSDAATGLSYMQQRYMDVELARFVSVDPVGASPVDGRNFNRYWYAGANPVGRTDPDGRCDGISTCRIASEERAVMRGEMTQDQKDANDTARGVGAMIGAALVVAGRAVLPVAPVLAKSAVKEVQQEIKGERKQRNAPPGPDARAEGNPHSRIEREGADGQYTTHNGDGTFKQYRGSGKDHGQVPRPNVKETKLNVAPNGQSYPGKPEVRSARTDEIPKGK
ncbi:RHS repeat-associated core domain-containing protein [Stenotrophomonas chelatiphaga]|uniref:RHS repeat-associated core domain-containing protein n=1 Tax=Stenotrophomonas chelatiphaga TaxID=517011 RepID=UPI00289E29FC|nr:RHS repeat-associated core domain-containing protein [Stenotrophomonas chelatiphaga]